MPDGTVPSSTEALRAALSAARASLERQLRATRSDAAEDALRQVKSALRLLPAERIRDIPEIEWRDADPTVASIVTTAPADAVIDAQVTTAPPTTADDLTRIRGIDDVLAKRLSALGIQRFAQIAAWQPEDVRVIADAMGLGRRFLAVGIVEQAVELERGQVEARATAQSLSGQSFASPTATGLQSVAVWEPKPSVDGPAALIHAAKPWQPLSGDDLRTVIAIIRTKRPMNSLVRLAEVAPVLNEPIYIATDHDHAVELPRWRTGVLVPFVEARHAPDLTQLARTAPAAQARTDARRNDAPMPARVPVSAEAARAMAAFHSAVTAAPAAQPVEKQSIHVSATTRINDLEAELELMARPAEAQGSRAAEPDAFPQRVARRVAEPPIAHGATPFGSREDVAEADVEFVVSARPKAPLLAPLPELPLTARSRVAARVIDDPGRDAVHGYGRVEEAAVVIVRRTSAEPAAAGLAFYAPPKADNASGPVRRFMRALAGS